ncbi:MAG: hypothetical protein QOD94_162 [Alphaproteobacteria bacterium]|nr:hypothetical protein [Alphaproteobacteria bacterium]
MSEWWTYSLSDFLLFSPRTYYRLFELYNLAIWPAQIGALILGVAIVALLLRGDSRQGRAVAAILAGCWLWVAWAYLLVRYDTINWAARYFASGFVIEVLLLIWTGLIRNRLVFRPCADVVSKIGLGIFLFALCIQPLIGPLIGRPWSQVELFGIAPDPTAVGTLGVLLTANRSVWTLLLVPLLWCAISGATLLTMQSMEAFIMLGLAALVIILAVCQATSRPVRWGRGSPSVTD